MHIDFSDEVITNMSTLECCGTHKWLLCAWCWTTRLRDIRNCGH